MSLFEIILITLVGVYVLTSLYFTISGRILAIKNRNEDRETTRIQLDFEDQIKVLTDRLGQIATENHNLNNDLRVWKEAYVKLQQENEELKKKLEKPKKTTRKKKEVSE